MATCRAEKLPFITDASNAAEKFARGRLRRVLPLLAKEGLTIERLADLGARAGDAKAALDYYTAALLRVGTRMDEAGVVHIDLEQLRSAPCAIAERALSLCLQNIHPEDYAPERQSILRVSQALFSETKMPSCTLHGCLLSKTGSQATLMREFSAIADAKDIGPGEKVIWDQRWQVTLAKDIKTKGDFVLRPLGNPPHELLDKLAPGLRKMIPRGRARSTLPALWHNQSLVLIPALPQSTYRTAAEAKVLTLWPPIIGNLSY